MGMERYRHQELTGRIIKAAHAVHNTLGYGFLEKVYRNALAIELGQIGLTVDCERPITVYYGGEVVGDYYADLLVEGKVIVEVKAVSTLAPVHEAQLINYLKATAVEIGLLINFGPSVEVRRRIFTS